MERTANRIPGVHDGVGFAYRQVSLGKESFLPGGARLDGSKSRDPLNTDDVRNLRAGLLLGHITTGNKLAPAIIGVTTVAYDQDGSDNLQLTVSAATATEVVRRIGSSGTFHLTGPPSAAGTVATQDVTYSAVNTTTGVITIADLAADAIAGSFIQPDDGSETPITMVPNSTGMWTQDQTDTDITSLEFPQYLIGGIVDSSQILNWPSDASLRNWIMAKLNGGAAATPAAGPFIFDHRHGL